MTRLLIHVEGQTEERFVNQQLRPHLEALGWHLVVPLVFGRRNGRTGGVGSWQDLRRDIVRDLRHDAGRHVAVIVDFYGMPGHGVRAWPGRAQATRGNPRAKARLVEAALTDSICEEGDFAERFHPCVMMHEFETMLYTNPEALAGTLAPADALAQVQQIVGEFPSLEHINDNPQTAPSKRILAIDAGYQKAVDGIIVAQQIGLEAIRAGVPGVDAWLNRLVLS